jgi:small subunit ribosomal protein S20
MANTAQAKKRARQAEATRMRNASQKSELRTAVKKVRKAIAAGDKAAATKTLQESQAVMDRIADKKAVDIFQEKAPPGAFFVGAAAVWTAKPQLSANGMQRSNPISMLIFSFMWTIAGEA